jgi:hypothetical protein
MKKTSAVPLKKETVRVTLKANPETGKLAPKAPEAPTAAKPGDSPPAPAPTIPLKSANPGGPPAPRPAAPAPTVQLKTPGATTAPKTTPLKTQPVSTPGAQGTQALPRATVQLGSATQALGAPTALSATQAATIQTAVEEDDEESDTLAGVLSIVAFVLALAVLSLQLMTAMKWTDERDPVGGKGLNQLFE